MRTPQTGIYTAAASMVEAFALDNGLPVGMPGVQFAPPDEGMWLEMDVMPNDTETYGIGNGGPFVYRGIVQVCVYARPGFSMVSMLEMVDMLIDTFRKGTAIDAALIETEPTSARAVQDDRSVFFPVTIRYAAVAYG